MFELMNLHSIYQLMNYIVISFLHHEFMTEDHNIFVVPLTVETEIHFLYSLIGLHGIQYLILQARLNVGDIVQCTIKRFVYFGIFVEVDPVPVSTL